MARKRPHPEHENHERWLVSYADFITLLFAFFVVMFASSQTDKARAQQVSDSVRTALENGGIPAAVRELLGGTVDERGKGNAMMKGPGGTQKVAAQPEKQVVAELTPSMQYLTKALQEEIKNGRVDLHLEPRGLVVSLRESAFFSSGEDAINPQSLPTLAKIAVAIRDLPNSIRLEGHTDSVPIQTPKFRNNWELAAARGIAMLDIFADRYAVPRQRLAIAGYADTAPVAPNDTEEGRARNRRVDIVIINQQALIAEPASSRPGGKDAGDEHSKPAAR